MEIHVGNKLIGTTPEQVIQVKGLTRGRFVNLSTDTTIFIDISRDNLVADGGGFGLLPGKDIPVTYLGDDFLWAVVKSGVNARLSWILLIKA